MNTKKRFYIVESISKDIYFVPDEILHITDNRKEYDRAFSHYAETYKNSKFVEIHGRLIAVEKF